MKGGFLVAKRACDQCLLGPNKVVDDVRKASLLADCEREDTHFICHKSTIRDPDEGMCCRGFYEAFPRVGRVRRFAESIGLVEFADPDTGAVGP